MKAEGGLQWKRSMGGGEVEMTTDNSLKEISCGRNERYERDFEDGRYVRMLKS